MAEAEIGIIGGTGLYQIDGLQDAREVAVETPLCRGQAGR
jgi:purine nucleoside phosphorylase